MAIHCGFHRAGWAGLFVAGFSFIIPAALITGIFAWLYARFGTLPAVEPFLVGIKPAVLMVIVYALWRLGLKAMKRTELAFVGGTVILLAFLGLSEVLSILSGGAIGIALALLRLKGGGLHGGMRQNLSAILMPLLLVLTVAGLIGSQSPSAGFGVAGDPARITASTRTLAVSLAKAFSAANGSSDASLLMLWLVFLKIGSVLFGSGYVLIAFLQGELVTRRGWLTAAKLIDAVAVGQFTPGPVLSTATFIGYQIHGLWGAIVSTVGIFLPSFFFVAALNPFVPRLRKSALFSAFLDAVNVSSVALMAFVSFKLGTQLPLDWKTALVAAVVGGVLFKWSKINNVWVVLGGAALGYGVSLL
jgi:chromate transporter